MPPFALSTTVAALVAAVVGYAGTVALVIAAAQTVGATAAQTTSWLAAVCLGKAIGGMILTFRTRMPIVLAWSTPGAALVIATGGAVTLEQAVGAFVVAGALIVATALVRPLSDLVARIPIAIASAMLGGVLFRFVADVALAAPQAPLLVLPLVLIFLVARAVHAASVMVVVVGAGVILVYALGLAGPLPQDVSLSTLVFVAPRFDPTVIIGLALPLYLVTMAAQNLPGFAVLKANGFEPPVRAALFTTGLGSIVTAFAGAHTHNMAAITAAICVGPDSHPDPAKRWAAGVVYAAAYVPFALFAGFFVALFAAMPQALIATVAGLALVGALMASLAGAMAEERTRLPALLTFAAAASGVSVAGIGAAFWGLAIGLLALGVERLVTRR